MKRVFYAFVSSISCLITFGCTAPSPSAQGVQEFQSFASSDQSVFGITGIRHQSLRDAAMSVGARGGLAWRARQINQIVSRYHKTLDRIYNFHGVMLENHILPPVLIEGQNSLEVATDSVIRLADRQFSIESQARFVTMPPTWRDYVYLKYQKPEQPDPSMLPRTGSERKVWNRYIGEGWQAGIDQADSIFYENLGRLKRDYEGMVRYRRLLAQNMVTPPYVAKVNMGITGDNNQMSVNDRVFKITALPTFRYQTKGEDWVTLTSPVYLN